MRGQEFQCNLRDWLSIIAQSAESAVRGRRAGWVVLAQLTEQYACVYTLVIQLYLTLQLCNLMDSSPPGSSAPGILQARILGWVAIPFSRRPFQPRDGTHDSCIAGIFFTIGFTREAIYILSGGKGW